MFDYHCVEHEGRCIDVRCEKCPHRVSFYPLRRKSMPTLYLDLDGVLADYDKRADEICGMSHTKYEFIYGPEAYSKLMFGTGNIFDDLEVMPDAPELLWAIGARPYAVLTALPKTGKDKARDAKRRWVAHNLGEHVPVICCLTHEKSDFCGPGDILVDDRNIQRKGWEAKDGIFILHHNAKNTIDNLRHIGAIE